MLCTKKIDNSKDKKERRRYSDRRSALKKYKEYLDACFKNIDEKEVFLRTLEASMKNKKLKPKSVEIYLSKIRGLLENGCSVSNLCNSIDEIIRNHRKGGNLYDESDSGNTSAALGHVQQMVKSPYIHYKGEKSSWVFQSDHLTEYYIEGNTITFSKDIGRLPGNTFVRVIDKKDMKELIEILDEAKVNGLFEKSNTSMHLPHYIGAFYDYGYSNVSGVNCGSLFIICPRSNTLFVRYNALIQKITN